MKKNKLELEKITVRLLPPVIVDILLAARYALSRAKFAPSWQRVTGGPLRGRQVYVSVGSPAFRSMLDGTYDAFFYDYLQSLDFTGKTVYDIGAHIGYHTLCFASLVGQTGQVMTFEPNPYNFERIKVNLSENMDLAKRIHLMDVALSNKTGQTRFHFSTNIENMTSSGGYIDGAFVPPLSTEIYSRAGFSTDNVELSTLDQVCETMGNNPVSLIKIDVEGAEHLVIEGGLKTISRDRPILLIEVHSVIAMLALVQHLLELEYKITPIGEVSRPSRCFIVAESK